MGKWKDKAREELNEIVAAFAYKDYKQANPKPRYDKNGMIKRKPYTLSAETLAAEEVLSLTYNVETTKEEEERIKAYLLPFRLGTRKL